MPGTAVEIAQGAAGEDAPGAGGQVLRQGTAAAVNLVLDDGSAEGAFGLNNNDTGRAFQFIWLNRFTPSASQFPFRLEEIWVLFIPLDTGSVNVGDAIHLAVYEDSDTNPTNGATLRAAYSATVLAVDGTNWSAYTLSTPVEFTTPKEILIAVINRGIESGVSPISYPAAQDSTSSQGRSWLGWWVADPPNPPALPTDATLVRMDDAGYPGNWMIRGHGQTSGNTAPTFGGLPDQWLAENSSRNNAIDLWAYATDVQDSDANLAFSITNSPAAGAGVSLDGNRYIDIFPNSGWSGTTNVQVRVQDTGSLTASDTFVVTVSGDEKRAYLPLVTRALGSGGDPYEPNDTFAQAWGPLTSGTTYQAYFPTTSDTNDYYHLTLPAAHSIDLRLTKIPPGNDYDLYLYDAAHVYISHSGNLGNADEQIITGNKPAGKYYVRILRQEGTSQTQPYSLRALFQ